MSDSSPVPLRAAVVAVQLPGVDDQAFAASIAELRRLGIYRRAAGVGDAGSEGDVDRELEALMSGLVFTTSHTALPVPALRLTSAIGTVPALSVAVTLGKESAAPSLALSLLTSWA